MDSSVQCPSDQGSCVDILVERLRLVGVSKPLDDVLRAAQGVLVLAEGVLAVAPPRVRTAAARRAAGPSPGGIETGTGL